MNSPFRLAAIALASLSAHALLAEQRLLTDQISVAPVSEVSIQLVATNEGDQPLRLDFGPRVAGVLHGGSDRSEEVTLTCDDPRSKDAPGETPTRGFSCEVAPGAYLRVRYILRIPVGCIGPVVLEVPSFSDMPVMFSVQSSRQAAIARASAARAAASASTSPATALPPATPAASPGSGVRGDSARPAVDHTEGERQAALRRATRVLPGVSAYEPVYFGLGAGGGLNAKFQFSLKYNPFDMRPLYMGFTQTSVWDLRGDSKPFRDSAYRPSLFFLKEKLWSPEGVPLVFGLQGGFEHESNGKGGLDSRSINIAFVRPRLLWRINEDMRLIVSPKAYGYLEKSENSDIAEYRGYVDLGVAFHYKDWKLSTNLRKGTRANYGSIQVDAVMPLHITDRMFERIGVYGVNGYWFLQYFNGWGETIIDYRRKLPSQFRAGVMVVP